MWVLFTLFSAFSLATSDALLKKALAEEDEYAALWLRLVFSLPLLFAVLLFIDRPALDREFYAAFVMALPLEVVSMALYVKALRLSPMSLTLPFLSLTPIFLIVFSFVILGEKVSATGTAGILLVAAGGYSLNLHSAGRGISEPIKAIFREKGSVLMIFVALIYSTTSSLGKMAVNHSSALFFASTYYIALTAAFTPAGLRSIRKRPPGRRALKYILPSGVFLSLMVISHMIAISMGKVAYMIAVKRTSLLIGVLYGFVFFGEGHARERLLGAALMFLGLVLLVTAK